MTPLPLSVLVNLMTTAAGKAAAPAFLPALNHYLPLYLIVTPSRIAAFLGQALVESEEFTHLRESTLYTHADVLLHTFPHEFVNLATAEKYVGNAQAIANRAYANRNGNGDEASGDGWNFRGGGLFGLTGRDNYKATGLRIGLDLVGNPMQITKPDVAVATACDFWAQAKGNAMADARNIQGLTRAVNGPAQLAYERRLDITTRALKLLAGN